MFLQYSNYCNLIFLSNCEGQNRKPDSRRKLKVKNKRQRKTFLSLTYVMIDWVDLVKLKKGFSVNHIGVDYNHFTHCRPHKTSFLPWTYFLGNCVPVFETVLFHLIVLFFSKGASWYIKQKIIFMHILMLYLCKAFMWVRTEVRGKNPLSDPHVLIWWFQKYGPGTDSTNFSNRWTNGLFGLIVDLVKTSLFSQNIFLFTFWCLKTHQ